MCEHQKQLGHISNISNTDGIKIKENQAAPHNTFKYGINNKLGKWDELSARVLSVIVRAVKNKKQKTNAGVCQGCQEHMLDANDIHLHCFTVTLLLLQSLV